MKKLDWCNELKYYPIISRIGLKWNIKEATFVSFAGLRGAIAIALAIALDSELRRDTAPGDPRREEVTDMFGVTGGIVLFSLVFNGRLLALFFEG